MNKWCEIFKPVLSHSNAKINDYFYLLLLYYMFRKLLYHIAEEVTDICDDEIKLFFILNTDKLFSLETSADISSD